MSRLNYLCENDDSDEDCYHCKIKGYLLRCPKNCEYFDDVRKKMTPEQLAERKRLMAILGVKDFDD